jgi:hypothetical protein
VVKARFSRGFCEKRSAQHGFWMVFCGEVVVKTWFEDRTFPALKKFHFFEVYFPPPVSNGSFLYFDRTIKSPAP